MKYLALLLISSRSIVRCAYSSVYVQYTRSRSAQRAPGHSAVRWFRGQRESPEPGAPPPPSPVYRTLIKGQVRPSRTVALSHRQQQFRIQTCETCFPDDRAVKVLKLLTATSTGEIWDFQLQVGPANATWGGKKKPSGDRETARPDLTAGV